MAMPVWGWVLIGVGGIATVAIIANAVSQPAQLPQGPIQNPVTPTVQAPVDAGAEAARGLFGLLGTATTAIAGQVGRDRDIAEQRRRDDAAAAERRETRAHELSLANARDSGQGR